MADGVTVTFLAGYNSQYPSLKGGKGYFGSGVVEVLSPQSTGFQASQHGREDITEK